MRIESPDPKPRESGDYRVEVTTGYGRPTGDIHLDENGDLRLLWLNEGDCDRLIKAATEIKAQVAAYRAEMAAPHGRRYIHKGTCQLCGKPEGDELHDEPRHPEDPEPVTGRDVLLASLADMQDEEGQS